MSLDDTYFYYFSPKLSPREFGFPLRSLVSQHIKNPANAKFAGLYFAKFFVPL